jgi:endoplasmic reticulum junction formation protein lunapark
MGEDEALPTNRLALFCTSCRLVNGLAPPGVRTLEELGKWRCGSCGAWNGVEAQPVPIPGVEQKKSKDKEMKKEVEEEKEEEVEEDKDKGEEEAEHNQET